MNLSGRQAPSLAIVVAPLGGLLLLALTALTSGLSPSLIGPDEGGHYVNALFLGDWLRAGLPSPMPFAQGFYAHFPRLTIGHWPPGWYMIEAPLFAVLRPSPLRATMLGAIVAGLPAGAIVWALARTGRPRIGVALGGAYLLLPQVVDGARHILLDQPVTLAVALAAIAWAWATERPSWLRLIVFALFAAACPLVKGNGALVALVPAFDIALTRRWALLRRPALWGAALLAIIIVAPWYWLSFAISAGGFNYPPGPAYAWLALTTNLGVLWHDVGPAGLLLALVGATAAWRIDGAGERRIARLAVAVIAATLVFQSLVPASLEPRYVAPMLPWLVVLIGFGVVALWWRARWTRIAAIPLAIGALAPALTALVALPPKIDLGAPALARRMATSGGLWLVDGRAGSEGALIAAAAHADRGERRIWVARASQWLSASDFMGRDYRLTARTSAQAAAVLDRIGATGAVSVAERGRLAYPHSRVLVAALRPPGYRVGRRQFPMGGGSVLVAMRPQPVPPNIDLVGANAGSANVARMKGKLKP